MDYLSVKDFERFQHYKDRAPPWIKFYASLLDNYEWACLQDASKAHLAGIWLLASKTDNRVPADPEWIAKRIGATEPVDLQPLVQYGFIELDSKALARCKQNACLETETETEQNRRQQKNNSKEQYICEFDTFWKAYPKRAGNNPKSAAKKAFLARAANGVGVDQLMEGVGRYHRYCEAEGSIGTKFVLMASTWLGPNTEGWKQEWEPTQAIRRAATDLPLLGAE